jgi:hypothetical protein
MFELHAVVEKTKPQVSAFPSLLIYLMFAPGTRQSRFGFKQPYSPSPLLDGISHPGHEG